MDYDSQEDWSDDYCDEYDEYLDRAENYYQNESCGPAFASRGGSSYQSASRNSRNIENSLSKGFKELGIWGLIIF